MATNKKTNEQSRAIITGYKNRLQLIKQGQMYEKKGELLNAVSVYEKYFDVVSRWYNTEPERLKPDLFKKNNPNGEIDSKEDDLHEIFLISLVSWNLCRIYAYSDKEVHLEKLELILARFALFSMGYKFQFLNCETIRKYLKKTRGPQQQLMEKTYQELRIHSKRCYIATYCYGVDHTNLDTLRYFRDNYLNNIIGNYFIRHYYNLSPSLIVFLNNHSSARNTFTGIIRPLLSFFIKFLHFVIPNVRN